MKVITGPIGSLSFDAQFSNALTHVKRGEYLGIQDNSGRIIEVEVVAIQDNANNKWDELLDYFRQRVDYNWAVKLGEYGEVYVGGHFWHRAVFAAAYKGWWKHGRPLYRFQDMHGGRFYSMPDFALEVILQNQLNGLIRDLVDELETWVGGETCDHNANICYCEPKRLLHSSKALIASFDGNDEFGEMK